MKEFFERFGLTEVLGYLFPGTIALCALIVWGRPDAQALLGADLGKNVFVTGALLLILAYATGLLLSMWSVSGAEQLSILTILRPGLQASAREWRGYHRDLVQRWIVEHTLAALPSGSATSGALLEVHAVLERVFTLPNMLLLSSPTTKMSVFRAIATDQLRDKVAAIVFEAEVLRRRFMFSVGVALAFLVLAASSALRVLVTALAALPETGTVPRTACTFIVIAFGALTIYLAWHLRTVSFIDAGICMGAAVAILFLPFLAALPAVSFDSSQLPVCLIALLSAANLIALVRLWSNPNAALPALLLLCATTAALALGLAFTLAPAWLHSLAEWDKQNPANMPILCLIAAASVWIASRLRSVAARCWERELAHTLAIARIFGHQL